MNKKKKIFVTILLTMSLIVGCTNPSIMNADETSESIANQEKNPQEEVADETEITDQTVSNEETIGQKKESETMTTVIKNGLVSGTTGAQAIEGGVEILKAGGNAADAAIATSLGQIALAAGSWVSYAGIFNMVYYEADTGKVYDINGGYNTVLEETEPMTIEAQDLSGLTTGEVQPSKARSNGRAVLVPGFMATVEEVNHRFGELPFEKLFEPAIRIAEEGFEWNEGLNKQLAYRKDTLSRLPETKAIFTKEDGNFYEIGDLFTQPELANTLKKVAKEGSDYMYTGPWAEKLVQLVQADGGHLTMQDMANYEPIITEPALWQSKNGDYQLYVHNYPAFGGVMLNNAMSLIESAEVPTVEHYTDSPEAMYDLLSILNYVSANTTSPISNEEADEIWNSISNHSQTPPSDNTPKHSDAVVVIDKDGNIAAVTHSINTVSWG